MSANLPLVSTKAKPFAPLSVVVGGLALSYPLWRFGLTVGGDAIFHSIWYTAFARQFLAGELYPRWLVELNGGLGSPTFFFYPPLPYYAALLFSPLLNFGPHGLHQLGAAAALALTASGVAAYLWLKSLTGGRAAAAIASLFYMAAPYHLSIDVYTRAAYAEAWAFVWMPLTLYFVRLMASRRRLAFAGLALSYAGLLMTHPPTTLIFSAVPPCYALLISDAKSRKSVTLLTLGGLLCGAGLASVYLLPALTTQANITVKGFSTDRYNQLWLKFSAPRPDDLESQLFWSVVLTSAVAVCAMVFSRSAASPGLKRERLFWAGVALASVVMMFPVSDPVWRLVTKLQWVQFPWRFSSLLCVATAALLALGLASLKRPYGAAQVMACTLALLLVACFALFSVYAAGRAYPPRMDPWFYDFFLARYETMRDAPEYRPATAASIHEPEFHALLDRVCREGGRPAACVVEGEGTVNVEHWRPRDIALTVNSPQGVSINVSQFYYNGWTAYVDESPYTVQPSRPDGLLNLRLPAGAHNVHLLLSQSRAEAAGKVLSAATALLLPVWLFAAGQLRRKKSGGHQRVAAAG